MRMLKYSGRCLSLVLWMWILSSTVFAQSAELRGLVSDQTGAVLPGVSVKIKNDATGVERDVVTDEAGAFRVPALQPAPYTISSELPGFKTDIRHVTLTVGQVLSIRITLGLGEVAERVEVTEMAAVPQVDTAKSDLSGVITSLQIQELPLLNGGFLALAQLLPGAAPSSPGSQRFGVGTSFGGARVRSSYSLVVDGGSVDDTIYGLGVTNVNQEAVQEFRVLRNQFDAEYSRAGTAIVTVLTRSGTNDLRGSFSYFGRDDALNARNAFARTKPPFDYARLSSTLGGPIMRDKTHFFAAFEYLRQNSVNIISLPSTNPFSSIVNGVYPTGSRQKTGQFKLDHQFNARHSAFLRYLYDRHYISDTFFNSGDNFLNYSQNIAGHWNWTPSPTKVNTLAFYHLYTVSGRYHNSTDAQVSRPSYTFGHSTNLNQDFPRVRWTLKETLFWTRPTHAIKIGADVSYEISKWKSEYFVYGSWTFNTDRPFAANDPTTWPIQYQTGSGRGILTYKNAEMGFFFQDDWRFTDRLTFNIGLRYDLDTNLRDNRYISRLLADAQYAGLEKFVKSPRGNDWTKIQPRLGFAWDAKGDGRTVVRGGYGLYAIRNKPWNHMVARSLTSQFLAEVNDPNLLRFYPDRVAVLGGKSPRDYITAAGGRNLQLPGDNLKLGYSQNFTLGLGKTLFRDSVLEVDLVRQIQSQLYSGRDHNLPARGPLRNNPRPVPQFGQVIIYRPHAMAFHSALQAQYRSQFRRVSLQGSYSWSKSQASATGDFAGGFTDPFNERGSDDRGALDPDDRQHIFSWSAMIQIPYGFQLASIVGLRSGNPWDITAGVDLDGDGQRGDRPRGLAAFSGGRKSEANLGIINGFRASRGLAPITMEQLSQSSVARVVDLRLTKKFNITESRHAELFFEGYNVFNSVGFENATGNMSSGSFAIRTQARDARQLQWGGKFVF